MKVVVEGGSQAVIDKLNELGHEDLEIVNEGGDLTLDEKAQELLLNTTSVDATNKLIMELIMAQHSDKFFKVDRVNDNPMKVSAKKLKKRRAKNKMAKKSRKINYAKAKSKRKSHA